MQFDQRQLMDSSNPASKTQNIQNTNQNLFHKPNNVQNALQTLIGFHSTTIRSQTAFNSELIDLAFDQLMDSSQFQNIQALLCLLFAVTQNLLISQKMHLLTASRWQIPKKQLIVKCNSLICKESGEIDESSSSFIQLIKIADDVGQLRRKYSEYFRINMDIIFRKNKSLWNYFAFNAVKGDLLDEDLNDQIQFKDTIKHIQTQVNHLRSSFNTQTTQSFQSMMQSPTLLPASKYNQPNCSHSPAIGIPIFKPGMKIKDLMLLQLNMQTISLVDRCQTYACPFLLFNIPFSYLLAQTLTYYDKYDDLYIARLFFTLIQQINKISKMKVQQSLSAKVIDHVVELVSFKKLTSLQLVQKLGIFIKQNEAKMRTFLPVYFQIFSFHAFEKHKFIDQICNGSGERRTKIKTKIKQVYQRCQKYNNQEI